MRKPRVAKAAADTPPSPHPRRRHPRPLRRPRRQPSPASRSASQPAPARPTPPGQRQPGAAPAAGPRRRWTRQPAPARKAARTTPTAAHASTTTIVATASATAATATATATASARRRHAAGNGNSNQQITAQRPANIPEGFPQYSLGDLKRMPAQKLLDIAEQLNICEGVARARKQDVIFALLKVLTRHGEGVAADGVLEILPDGFGFLRAAEASYLAGPDDTYISPIQIRRFNLRTGDHLSGRIRWPKDGERYFALAVVDTHQRRADRGVEEQGPVREPDAAVPAPQVQARARRRQHRGHHRPHPRPDGAAGQRPARIDRVAAESRQDDDDAAGRHRDHAQPSGRAPDRAADRRASRKKSPTCSAPCAAR